MDDLISRQAAIDTIVKLTTCNGVRELFEYVQEHHLSDMWSGGIVDAIDAVIGVPSAQPGLDEWCTGCKEYDKERHCCPRWNRVIRETLKDTQLERPIGHWIEREEAYGDLYYECSECKESFVLIDGTPQDNLYNYCPNCGARMEAPE